MAGYKPNLDGMDLRLAGLMEGVAARVWLADLRPAMAMSDRLAAEHGDAGTCMKADPAIAMAVYREMAPLAWNTAAAKAYGLPERHPADLLVGVPPTRLGQLVDTLGRVLGGERSGVVEFRARTDTEEFIATRFSWVMVGPPESPESEAFMVSLERGDLVSDHAAAWERSEQVRRALQGTSTAVYMFDRDLHVGWVENARTRQDFDFTGLTLEECFGADAGAVLAAAFRPIIEDGVEGGAEVAITRDGVTRYFDFQAKPWRTPTGLISGLVGTNIEVTERETMLRDIALAAVSDPLTGLANRQALVGALDDLAATGPDGAPTALIAFDVPKFQTINDVYGHDIGDACLLRVARVLRDEVQPGDLVARFGGDQFAAVIHGTRAATSEAVEAEALRLKECIEGSEIPASRDVVVRLQIAAGIASGGGAGIARRTGSAILGDVDIALAQAKRTRATVSLIEADAAAYREVVRRRLEWGSRVRASLDADDVTVMAQPIVDLATGESQAFELLVRLRGDDGAYIPASAFMPDIDLLGMTPLLDRWMVRRAVEMLAEHAEILEGRRLAVNVSATTFTSGGLIDVIDQTACRTGADLSRLAVEMTETEAVADIEGARIVADGLHERGCLFVLDDFGSGAAAPVYLTELPVDWLKIDGRFVKRAPESPIDRAIVAGAITKAQVMGIPVVAEWIEDDETHALMSDMGAVLGQGYLFGAAGPIPEVFGRS